MTRIAILLVLALTSCAAAPTTDAAHADTGIESSMDATSTDSSMPPLNDIDAGVDG